MLDEQLLVVHSVNLKFKEGCQEESHCGYKGTHFQTCEGRCISQMTSNLPLFVYILKYFV